MPRRVLSGTALVSVTALEVGAVAALHRLGSAKGLAVRWTDLAGWLAETPTEDVLVALVRVLALGVAAWLLASTALYLAASLLRAPALLRGVEWATVPGVRRMVDGLLAGSIVAGSALGAVAPAVAQATGPVPTHAYEPRPAGDSPVYTPVPAGDGPPLTTADVRRTPVEAVPRPPAVPGHRVRLGENLWRIAEKRLATATRRPVGALRAAEVHRHWLRLIETNRERLRSGDPDLIYPDEELVLPEVGEP